MRPIISAGTIAILGSLGAFPQSLDVRPMMDCKSCRYRSQRDPNAGEYCYMFRDKPAGTRCGAFKQRDGTRHPVGPSAIGLDIIAAAQAKRARKAALLRARDER